jgi:translation elongation factor EF-1alpha
MYFKADAGALAVSARKSEFKTDFERGGQTRKHMMLDKASGINKLIVTVNRMNGLLSHCTMG